MEPAFVLSPIREKDDRDGENLVRFLAVKLEARLIPPAGKGKKFRNSETIPQTVPRSALHALGSIGGLRVLLGAWVQVVPLRLAQRDHSSDPCSEANVAE